jgi:hypothetical protein
MGRDFCYARTTPRRGSPRCKLRLQTSMKRTSVRASPFWWGLCFFSTSSKKTQTPCQREACVNLVPAHTRRPPPLRRTTLRIVATVCNRWICPHVTSLPRLQAAATVFPQPLYQAGHKKVYPCEKEFPSSTGFTFFVYCLHTAKNARNRMPTHSGGVYVFCGYAAKNIHPTLKRQKTHADACHAVLVEG